MKKLFVSYSSKDQAFFERFEVQSAVLRRTGKIDNWHMGLIKPNEAWDDAIQRALDDAEIVVMLLSPDFFASDYIWENEFTVTLDRWNRGDVLIAGIVLRSCDWRNTPVRKIQLISNAQVISEASNEDAAWQEAIRDLARIL